MKELNKNTLRDALNRLPEHSPPGAVWSGLSRKLMPSLSDRLPFYQPPTSVWNGLSEQLPVPNQNVLPRVPGNGQASKGLLRRLPLRRLSIAAALVLTMGLGYTALAAGKGPTVTYARTQEVAPAYQNPNDWDDAEESFTTILAQLEEINEPELNNMRMELEELTAAKQEVKAMLVTYGEDPKIIRQLAAIERDRSDVYRRIIVKI